MADEGQGTPSEYASEKLLHGMEDIWTEAGHIVVNTGKDAYHAGKSAIQKYREKRREKAEQQQQESEKETPDSPAEKTTAPAATEQPKASVPAESPALEGSAPPFKKTQIKDPARRNNNSIKEIKTTEKASKQTIHTTKPSIKTAERSLIGTQKSIKTTEQSSRIAKKSSKDAAKTTQMSAQAATKAAEKAAQITQATAKAVAEGAKAVAAATKELGTAIAAGGWVAVVIIIVIMVIALLVGSGFGIFFSGEDTGSAITLRSIVQEIHTEYLSSLESIRNMTDHDRVEFSGSMAAWPEVLSIYTVKVNTDPSNPQDVASMDNRKKAILTELFWAMNQINHKIETTEETVLVEATDEDGNIIVTETTKTATTLYITITHKTAAAMAHEHGFTEEQKQLLTELLQDENASMWEALLYGLPSAEKQFA